MIDGRPINSKDEYEIIGLGKPNEISKSPWEYKVSKRPRKPEVSKWAKEAQGKKGHRSP